MHQQKFFQSNMREMSWAIHCLKLLLVLMDSFSKDLKNSTEYFPRRPLRYVDGIFAIFNTSVEIIGNFVFNLNNKSHSIKFTYKVENKGQLPFVDVLQIKSNLKFSFDIYRKTTSTVKYIPSNSHYCQQYKMDSFNILIHRILLKKKLKRKTMCNKYSC